MLDVRSVTALVQGLSEDRLYGWTTEGLVRPTLEAGEVYYQEVDVARLRLLVTLEDDIEVDRDTVPVVVELLDQIHGLRRALRVLGEAVGRQPDPVRADIRATVAALMGTAPGQTED